jgi:hypothetical protein
VAIRLLETLLIQESLFAKAVHFDELEESWKTKLPHLRSGVAGGQWVYGPMPQVRHDRRAGLGIDSEAGTRRLASLSRDSQRREIGGQMSRRRRQAVELTSDRRVSNRLPIERDVSYKVLGSRQTIRHSGLGKTLNMSSRGVLFTTESGLPAGAHVELAISWPAKLHDAIRLKLVAKGVLVRSDENQAAISIHSYEFRTHGLSL